MNRPLNLVRVPICAVLFASPCLPPLTTTARTAETPRDPDDSHASKVFTNPLKSGEWSSIRAAHEAWKHSFHSVEGGFIARHPGMGWRMHFDEHGFVAMPKDGGWEWGLEMRACGFAGDEDRPGKDAITQTTVDGQRLTRTWNSVVQEWFVNDHRGLEHGFTVMRRPPGVYGETRLVIELSIRGELRPHVHGDGQSVSFVDESGSRALTYSGLKVWDAGGWALPARMTAGAGVLWIEVDEQDARYPLTIDPVAQQAYLKASNNGVASDDNFGYSVAVSGDTLVIGAPWEDGAGIGVNPVSDEGAQDSGAAYVFVRNGTTWTQQAYLKASNTGKEDGFGSAVSVSGDTIIVGAPHEAGSGTGVNPASDESAQSAGAAYVFVRNGTTWTQQAYLKASNTGRYGLFGRSVAAWGEKLVIGALSESGGGTGVNPPSGAVYVFARNGQNWSQEAYLKASNAGEYDNFGASVAIWGNTIVVGADEENGSGVGVNPPVDESIRGSGAAYVFVHNEGTWSQQAYLKAGHTWNSSSNHFGRSVGVWEDTIVVGVPGETNSGAGVDPPLSGYAGGSGAAYIFVRNGTLWSQQAYLKASNAIMDSGFGHSVAISEDVVVIGAPQMDDATGVNQIADDVTADYGAAYVFVRQAGTWRQQAYLRAANTSRGGVSRYERFGFSVAASEDAVVMGSPSEDGSGVADVFVFEGSTWTQQASAKAANSTRMPGLNDTFGSTLAASGNTVVVGALWEDGGGTGVNPVSTETARDSGAAYVFAYDGTSWTQQAYLKASNPGRAIDSPFSPPGDNFGWSLAISGDTIVVGAPFEDGSGTGSNPVSDEAGRDSGAVYIFERNGTTWTLESYLKASNSESDERFGYSVAISGDTIVVGAPYDDGIGLDPVPGGGLWHCGSAYVFVRDGTGWKEQAYLQASNKASGGEFGDSVAISVDTIVVASRLGTDILVRNGSTWSLQAHLAHQPPMAISGDTLLFGSLVMVRNGTQWSEQAYLIPQETYLAPEGAGAGRSVPSHSAAPPITPQYVAISGDIALLGRSGDDGRPHYFGIADSGSAYVFKRSGSTWRQTWRLRASNPGVADRFGYAVALSGGIGVISAPFEDGSGVGVNPEADEGAPSSGAAYVFSGLDEIPIEPADQVDQDGDGIYDFAEAYFGTSPTVANAWPIEVEAGAGQVTLTWPEANAAGVTVTPQWSSDFIAWLASGESLVLPEINIPARTITVTVAGGNLRQATLDTSGLEFAALRLKITSPAQTSAISEAVGFRTETITAGVFNLLSPNLDNKIGASGAFDAVAGTTLTDNDVDFVTAFAATDKLILTITAGESAGTVQDVTAFGQHTVTTMQDISAPITNETRYELRKVQTVADLFGAGNEAGLLPGTSATADVIWIPDGFGGFKQVFRSTGGLPGVGWRRVGGGAADASQTAIPFTDSFFIQRRGRTNLDLVFVGHVRSQAVRTVVEPGIFAPVSRLIPIGVSLNDSQLQNEIMLGTSITADIIWNPNGTGGYDQYFYSSGSIAGIGWRQVGSGATDRGSVLLKSGYLIQRKNLFATTVTLRIPPGLDL